MTSRTDGLAALDAVLDDEYIIPVTFLELQFSTGTIYTHNDLGIITTLGNNWEGLGDLGEVGTVTQDTSGKPTQWRAILSGIDANIIDQALNQNIVERAAILYISFRNIVSGALVATPMEIDRGKMDGLNTVTGADEAAVELLVESEMIDFAVKLNLYLSDNQQQLDNAGDLVFQYLAKLKDVKITWAVGTPSANFSGDRQPWYTPGFIPEDGYR